MNAAKVYYQPTQYNHSGASIPNAREYAKAKIRKQQRRRKRCKRIMRLMIGCAATGLFVFSFSSMFLGTEDSFLSAKPEQNISSQSFSELETEDSFLSVKPEQNISNQSFSELETEDSSSSTKPEQSISDQCFSENEFIMETADQLIDEITHDGMTKKQKVNAVYAWLRMNCSYGGHVDRGDYLQAAYSMLTEKRGDCYSYFAASKLLFERMGIDNLDVQKVKKNAKDSNHYWNMVSLDDGKTWYHFDATPRLGNGDDFCMVTDAFLDAYSKAHNNSHNRDKSLYPATPVK